MLITRHELELHRIVVEKTYAPETINYHGAEFRQTRPLEVSAVAELEGEDIRIRGSLGTRVAAACVFASLSGPEAPDFHIINRHERT